MRNKKTFEVKPKDIFILRTPVLSINNIVGFNSELTEHYTNWLANDYFKASIYTASPDLYYQAIKWLNGEIKDPAKASKLMLSLHRYYLRMCSRCTPYGLFAGFAVGSIESNTSLQIDHPEQHTKYGRLDMSFMEELLTAIHSIPEVKQHLKYFSNNSLYQSFDKYRYVIYEVKDKERQYRSASINAEEYTKNILQKATDGATIQVLIDLLTNEEISCDEASSYIEELIENQVLVSELEPTLTGKPFLSVLIEKCAHISPLKFVSEQLIEIDALLNNKHTGIDVYQKIENLVKKIIPNFNSKDLIQTDLFLQFKEVKIEKEIIDNIVLQINKLSSLSSVVKIDAIESFIIQFKKRYDQQEIPLMQALDPESGVGYGVFNNMATDDMPLITDIITNQATNEHSEKTIAWGKIQQYQLEKYTACIKDNSLHIEITDEDIAALTNGKPLPYFPSSMYLMGSIMKMTSKETSSEVKKDTFNFLLKSLGGPSCANLLGRFCHENTLLTQKLKSYLKEEEARLPETIFAEIVHLPAARTGNILMRPVLRDYEIPYLTNSSVAKENQLLVKDLMVSVKNNKIVLSSKRLGKIVLPRMSTAHNTSSSSLPVYRFLTDLQFQEFSNPFHWHWGVLADSAFLPRVNYKNIILRRAQWTLKMKDYETVQKKQSLGLIEYISNLKEKWQIPQYVVMAEGDNELLLDLKSQPCLQILATAIQKSGSVTLIEFLEIPEHCLVKNEQNKSFTNEIIIPLAIDNNSNKLLTTLNQTIESKIKRHYTTCSAWLYTKIYCGSKTADYILTSIIKPLSDELLKANYIEKWFFIRYNDESGHHLRIRFLNSSFKDYWKVVLEMLTARLQNSVDSGQIHFFQTDTYQREIERYGADAMELSESIFYYDSEAVIRFIDLLEGEQKEQYRWLFAIRGIDMLLNDFEYDLLKKERLLNTLQKNFFSEFGGSKALSIQLNNSYREKMHLIDSILNPENDFDSDIEEAVNIFIHRSGKVKAIAQQLMAIKMNEHNIELDILLSDYIHMFLNRLFVSNQRRHELVVYHFLAKKYKSKLASAH